MLPSWQMVVMRSMPLACNVQEWTLALCETFRFNLPVDINWEYFDGRFLTE